MTPARRGGSGPTLEDVRRLALALPETGEKVSWGNVGWTVKGKLFVWDRPLRNPDVQALEARGAVVPAGTILGLYTGDEGLKLALAESEPDRYFTIPHLDGYPAVLALLDRFDHDGLEEAVGDAWLARAPAKLAKAFLDGP